MSDGNPLTRHKFKAVYYIRFFRGKRFALIMRILRNFLFPKNHHFLSSAETFKMFDLIDISV